VGEWGRAAAGMSSLGRDEGWAGRGRVEVQGEQLKVVEEGRAGGIAIQIRIGSD